MEWWATLYDETVADLFLERDSEATLTHQIDFLEAILQLKTDDLVFDQCCGIGSLAIPLAARGKRVVGVDFSPNYIDEARRRALEADLNCQFFHGDGLDFVPEFPCDAAFNWGTCFGNAKQDAENKRMLERAFESLKPGGQYLVDFPNMANLLMNFKPVMLRRKGNAMILRESEIDLREGCLKQEWTIITPAETKTRPSSVRLYLPHELERMMASVGFRDIRLYGDLSGDLLDASHARCLVLGSKP